MMTTNADVQVKRCFILFGAFWLPCHTEPRCGVELVDGCLYLDLDRYEVCWSEDHWLARLAGRMTSRLR